MWPKRHASVVIDSAMYLLTISSPDIDNIAMSLYDIILYIYIYIHIYVAAEKGQHSEGEEQRSSKSNENAGLAGKYNNVPRVEQMPLLLIMNATRA